MGILGNLNLKRRGREVVVGYDDEGSAVRLTVNPPPLGLVNDLSRKIPSPVAPLRKDSRGRPIPVTDDKGKPIMDPASGQALMERDHSNPEHLERLERREVALNLGLILACLSTPIEPKTKVEDHGGDYVEYYHAVWKELEEAGLDIGAYRALSTACTELSLPLGEQDMKLAREALAIDEESQTEIKKALREEGHGKVQGK